MRYARLTKSEHILGVFVEGVYPSTMLETPSTTIKVRPYDSYK